MLLSDIWVDDDAFYMLSCVMLQMYHASRESFLYLQEFYIGELVPADKPHVPLGGKQPASEDFMVQLREYTEFRQPLLQQLAQSTPATHLGARRV